MRSDRTDWTGPFIRHQTGEDLHSAPVNPTELSIGKLTSRRLATLINGGNAEAALLGQMLKEASKHGTVKIRRIYGDWIRSQMSQWRTPANTYAFHTPHQIAFTAGKNATDGFLIIDAMDLLHSGSVDGFCTVSSDSDFTGLAKRIREQELFMMGTGRGSARNPSKTQLVKSAVPAGLTKHASHDLIYERVGSVRV